MKRFVLLLIVIAGISACQKPEEIMFSDGSTLTTRSITPNVSPVFDWWDTTSISLLGINSPVTLPWYNGTSTQIPYYLLDDYKPEDGWEMVYNYCIDTPPGEEGKYYLMFYNKFTGILRVFYYNNHDVTAANTTLWRLEVTEPTSLFNALGRFSSPTSVRVDNPVIYVTNLTDYPSKSIARGWNCFDIELAYDDQLPQSNAHFNIGMYNMTSGSFDLHGEIDLETEGTIVTHSSAYPGWIGDASKAAGDGAKDYMQEKLKESSLEKNIVNIINNGVSGLISSGARFFLGALIGKKDNSYNSSVQLTTTGEMTAGGDFEVATTPNTLPIANNLIPGCVKASDDSFLPAYDEPLGVWSLEETPILYISPTQMWKLDELISYDREENSYFGRIHQESLVYYYSDSIKVKINPAVLDLVDKYEVATECVWIVNSTRQQDYLSREYATDGPRGDLALYTDDTVYVSSMGLPPMRNDQASMRRGKWGFTYCSFHKVPMTSAEYNLLRVGTTNFPLMQDNRNMFSVLSQAIEEDRICMKVTVTLYPKAPYDPTPIVSMRTFRVERAYDWDYNYQPPNWVMKTFN